MIMVAGGTFNRPQTTSCWSKLSACELLISKWVLITGLSYLVIKAGYPGTPLAHTVCQLGAPQMANEMAFVEKQSPGHRLCKMPVEPPSVGMGEHRPGCFQEPCDPT